jgi:putative ABC transport system permease protein
MFRYNLELALHGLRRFPRSTVLAVLTVALGLAASMTTLTLLHMLSADPLPGRSQHLYLAWVDTVQAKASNYTSLNGVTTIDYKRIKMSDAQALLLDHRAAHQAAMADMTANVETPDGKHVQQYQNLLATTSDFVPMFGVPLRFGRSWSTAEEDARTPVAVIDADLAQKLFSTANAVGQSIRLKDAVFRVIGVVSSFAPQPHFYGLNAWAFSGDSANDVFVPYTAALDAGLQPNSYDNCDVGIKKKSVFDINTTHCSWLGYWAQLDTPQQVTDYRTYLDHYMGTQKTLVGDKKSAKVGLFSVAEWLMKQNVVPDNVRLNVWLAGSFLLLCMVNVAGLLAAKFLGRSNEIGIRRALGAPRRAVFLQHVLEACAISVVGGVLALPLTLFGLWILRKQAQGFTDLARLDLPMFGALFALALAVGVVVGLLPSWRASRVEPGLQVKSA